MSTERRMERLRPEQFRDLRKQAPLAWLPLGILEWHAPQNPLGLDGVKAHAICLKAAAEVGGVVFPTMYYGPPPTSTYLDVEHYDPFIPKTYDLPEENFTTDKFGFPSKADQWDLFGRVLDSALRQIARYGFKAVVILSGHYPLQIHKIPTVLVERELGLKTWFGHEGMVAEPRDGDHAGQWETSITWALEPDTVDPDKFPAKGEPNYPGVMGQPIADITPELAQKNLDRALKGLTAKGKELLESVSP